MMGQNDDVVVVAMSLRDWFAGQALAICVVEARREGATDERIAQACYVLADAMLKEREVKP